MTVTTDPRPQQLDDLVTEHANALLSYVRTLVGDHHLAEDIVQETLIRAWRHTERLFGNEGSVRGWLLTVARNLAIDWLRSAANRHESLAGPDHAERGVPDRAVPDHAEQVVATAEVTTLLRRLSTEHRTVLLHTTMAGRTALETAQILGVPVGTIKSRQHYALNVLRKARIRPER
ncbi:sigma-70 family RNA polymerase sigma factor [Actinoplanes sp. L3-i22]|uniref:sigma-70 family RNA polymerase sigma factor n=1 Tax=Actinoplanes sp. L3-i22 TaxID=2836373 RepID=UPI001C761A9D|nr:sigma-70 family RNA polymerase sigma factor [Actinoplanes sp. L3-i22]BCY05755.1 DNA-directed RNA polymerase sigma-70 factor [Actinoplanes sp. L3-i22]